MTVVRVFQGNITNFFERQAFRGAVIPGANRKAETLARAMVRAAQRNAGELNQRTGKLKDSVVPIVRKSPRSGALVVGVGTTVEYGKHLEEGTRAHPITPQRPFKGRGKGGYFLRSNTQREIAARGHNPKPLRRPQLKVNHPGNREYRWLRRAVTTVMGRGV